MSAIQQFVKIKSVVIECRNFLTFSQTVSVHCARTCGRGSLCVEICVCEGADMRNCAPAHLRGQKNVWDVRARVVENLCELT